MERSVQSSSGVRPDKNLASDAALAAATSVAAAVSRNVRTFRARRNWTIETLAGRAKISKGMVIQIEQGRTNPSITTLARLANALDVNMATLLETGTEQTTSLVRAEDGAKVWMGQPGTAGVLMVSSHGADNAELWHNTLAAGDGLKADPHPNGTRELLLVVEGTLTVEVADNSYDLDRGDAITFHADYAHGYFNHSAAPARYSLTVVWPRAK